MTRWTLAAALVIGAVLSAGRATHARAAAKPGVALVCTLQPGLGSKGGVDRAALCETFRRRFEGVTGAPVRLVASVPAGPKARWITVDIRAPRRNALEARMTSQLSARRVSHPPIAIDVMDMAIGQRDVDGLAQVVAKRLTDR